MRLKQELYMLIDQLFNTIIEENLPQTQEIHTSTVIRGTAEHQIDKSRKETPHSISELMH